MAPPPGSRRKAWSPERTAEVWQDSPDVNGGPDADAGIQGLVVIPDYPACHQVQASTGAPGGS